MGFLSFLENDSVAIEVEFPMTNEIWETVLINAKEEVVLEEEDLTTFVVRYASIGEFEHAKERFDQSVTYYVI